VGGGGEVGGGEAGEHVEVLGGGALSVGVGGVVGV